MELKPEIGKWYKAYCGSKSCVYIIRLNEIDRGGFRSKNWRVDRSEERFTKSLGQFDTLIEEIPCPAEFQQIYIPLIFN